MTAPEPYTPEEGHVIAIAIDVPTEGWECRRSRLQDWHPPREFFHDYIVEARPIPVPEVMVSLPRDVAQSWADVTDPAAAEVIGVLAARCRAALEQDQ